MSFLPTDKYTTQKSDLSSEMIDVGEPYDVCPVCGRNDWMTQRFWVSGNDNSYYLTKNNNPVLVQHKTAWLKCNYCLDVLKVDTVIEVDLPGSR